MTKDKIISILKNSQTYVSGEAISNELGISRAAVNTAVKALRASGYNIESSTRKGYILVSSPDTLSAGEIMAYLDADRMNTVKVMDSVDSTNLELRRMASDGAPHGQIAIADEQTAGRGRRGRAFLSPEHSGIYFSILLRPSCAPTDTMPITACTAVAISRAIYNSTGIQPDIKWVNDIIINGKKTGGILTEMSVESESGHIEYLIIGIGINVNGFPAEIKDIATCIADEAGQVQNRALIAANMAKEMDDLAEVFSPAASNQDSDKLDEYLEYYRQHCITTDKDVKLISAGAEERAFALEINKDFSLRVRLDDGTEKNINYGEVSVRGMYDYAK